MIRLLCAFFLTMAATVAVADELLSGDDFEALSENRTLRFTLDGLPFGAEQFFSGRRSLWRTSDGACETGVWTERGEGICFTYESGFGPQCWRFSRVDGEVRANYLEDGVPVSETVVLDAIDSEPLDCPGPRVGS